MLCIAWKLAIVIVGRIIMASMIPPISQDSPVCRMLTKMISPKMPKMTDGTPFRL